MNYNEQLRKLHEEICCKRSLEAKLRELKAQYDDLDARVLELKKVLQNEQGDVDRLERTSLTSVFYSIMGKKEDKLNKEKAEAYAAKLKYDSAMQDLSLVREDIERLEAQLHEISGCELEYKELLKQKVEAIKTSGSAEAQQIFNLDEQISELKSQKTEIEEALSAGFSALGTVNSILESLDSAENWGTCDLIGGGIFSDIAKHNHLDEAQRKVRQLQDELRRFKTELTDVTIEEDMQVSVDGFLRFADYFFDSIFTDWAVMDKINQSQSSVYNTKSQVESVMTRLRSMSDEVDLQIVKLEEEKNSIITSAAI